MTGDASRGDHRARCDHALCDGRAAPDAASAAEHARPDDEGVALDRHIPLENDRAADDGGGIDLGSGAVMLHVPSMGRQQRLGDVQEPCFGPEIEAGRLEEEVPRGNARGGKRGP